MRAIYSLEILHEKDPSLVTLLVSQHWMTALKVSPNSGGIILSDNNIQV